MIADLSTPATYDGRVAVVTGAGSGIGRATVHLLAARGAQVIVADLDEASAIATVDGLGHDTARPAVVDVTSPAAVDDLMDQVIEAFGSLDIAVNAAGVSGTFASTAEQEIEDWAQVMDTNLTATFLCLRAEVRTMLGGAERRNRPGAIVNISSGAGSMGVPGLAPYSASKHGVVGLTRSAALEYARSGIRINGVLPGPVRTPMLQRFAGGDEGVDAMGRGIPIGRASEPEEIAQAIAWLCCDQASYVTGHLLAVDGGALAT